MRRRNACCVPVARDAGAPGTGSARRPERGQQRASSASGGAMATGCAPCVAAVLCFRNGYERAEEKAETRTRPPAGSAVVNKPLGARKNDAVASALTQRVVLPL
ncbi:hypothetical protein MRX96_002444 [Rhipicephalus microplus]